jgi:hypothetical protein
MHHKAEDGESGYARLFRMLSAANVEAENLDMPLIVHLTNMALLQVTLDWDGVDPEKESTTRLSATIHEKSQLLPFKRPQAKRPQAKSS